MPKKLNYTKFFSTYLAQPVDEEAAGEVRLNCPLPDCQNPTDHFYANTDDGTWHCKRCDRSGNARTLITLIHDKYLQETTEAQYISLSEVRGLEVETLRNAGFAYDYDEDRWLVPYYTYNPETETWSDFLNNLGYFYPSSRNEKMRFKIKKSSVLPLYLYNPGHVYPPSDIAEIYEGEWDVLAAHELFPDSENMILGKAGAGFKVDYLKTLSKIKKVQLLLDNDKAGRDQTAKSIDILQREIKDIEVLDWSLVENAPKDIRDMLTIHGEDAPDMIRRAIVPYDIEKPTEQEIQGKYQTDISSFDEVETFDEYIRKVKEEVNLYSTPEIAMSMAAVLGITNSIEIPGEPLWAFLIGPPSSGKTLFIDSFGGNNTLFDNLSKLTAKALVSGWKDETGDEPSYLALLRNKSLFVKDFTVTLMDSEDAKKEVFGLLTDIYDGYVKIPYGNNQVKEFYDLYFNMVAGVTDIVHQHSAATIGERFLRIDYLGKKYDRREFARRALQNFGQSKIKKDSYISATLGLVKHLKTKPIVMEIQDIYQEHLTDLAEFIATIRTKVESDNEGMKYQPRAELGARLAIQLAKLFVSTRAVYQNDDNDEELDIASKMSFEVVKKVALDTCYGFPLDIVRTIVKHPMADKTRIAKESGIHAQKAYRIIRDLRATGVLSTGKGMTSAKGGRPQDRFMINPILKPVLDYDCQEVTKRPRTKRASRNSRRSR